MSEQPKIGDKIRISYEGVVGALDEYRIYLDEPAGFSCGIKCVGNVRVEVLERADDPAKEQIALGEQIRKQIKRHNGGRAALELLKQHGGPDFTIEEATR